MFGNSFMGMLATNTIIAVAAYIIGNISPAILIGKMHGIDVRSEGSCNAGTTNVIRLLGVKAGLATLAVDVLKGFIAAKIGAAIYPELGILIAFIFVIMGHCFPAFYEFKGGKGVATTLGAALALSWQSALIALGIAILILLIFRIMSAASIIAVASYPFILYFMLPDDFALRNIYTIIISLIAVFIIFMHRENIQRLIKGEEKKLSLGRKEK